MNLSFHNWVSSLRSLFSEGPAFRRHRGIRGGRRAWLRRGHDWCGQSSQALEIRALLAVFTVSTTVDENDGNFAAGDLSLREAIAQANASGGKDTIQLGNNSLVLTLGPIQITDSLDLNGNSPTSSSVSGNSVNRIFEITAGDTVSLQKMTIRDGRNTAVVNNGSLIVSDCEFFGNQGGDGGAINSGGAINNLTIERSTFAGNSAIFSGGAIAFSDTTASISNSTFSGNTAVLFGGAMNSSSASVITIRNSTITNNRASINTPGVGFGGGISGFGANVVTLHNTILVGNTKNPSNTLNDLEISGVNTATSSNNLMGSTAFSGGISHGVNGNIVGNDHDNNAGTARIDWQANQVIDTNLANNGGFTRTHALIANSPALDAGDNANVPLTDLVKLIGGTATQSTTLSNNPVFAAGNALDGDPLTFSHTDSADTNSSWTFALNSVSDVRRVVLTNRNSSQGRLRDITVEILDEGGFPIFVSPVLNPRATAGNDVNVGPDRLTVDIPAGLAATRVRVRRLPQPGFGNTEDQNTLTLAEVAILGAVDQRGTARAADSTDAGFVRTADIGAFEETRPQFLSFRKSYDVDRTTFVAYDFLGSSAAFVLRSLHSLDGVADAGDQELFTSSGSISAGIRLLANATLPGSADFANESSYRLIVSDGAYTTQAVFYGIYQKGSDLMIHGTDGNDVVSVTATTVTINGATFSHTATNVRAFLHGGNDTFTTTATFPVNVAGGDGNDTITGGTGADRLVGEAGNDSLVGGAGNDVYFFDAGTALGTDTLNEAGGGSDQLNFSATTTQAIALNMGLATVQVVNPNLSLILGSASTFENFLGGQAGNNVLGNTLANKLQGGTANDTLAGVAGNDIYCFDADSPQGIDTVDDSAGIDTLDFSPTTTTNIFMDLGAFNSTSTNLQVGLTSLTAIENVTGTNSNDLIIGNSVANTLNGGDGNDRFIGQGGNDSLNGGAGDDSYEYDTAFASGTDTLTDTSGNDSVKFAGNANVTFSLLSILVQAANPNVSIKLGSATTFENVFGGGGNDTLTGNTLANVLSGGAGNDTLDGGTGNDSYLYPVGTNGVDRIVDASGVDQIDFSQQTDGTTLNLGLTTTQVVNPGISITLAANNSIEKILGGGGNDNYSGNALGNTLTGNGGNDTLVSGAGNDSLFGGLGDDTYAFDADNALGTDTLTELNGEGSDTLDFSATAAAINVNLGLTTQQTVVATKLNLTLNANNTFENVIDGAGGDTVTGNSVRVLREF